VILLEAVERPEADLAFAMKFTKSRERTPDNRRDYESAVITLSNDEWCFEAGGAAIRKGSTRDRVLELLQDALARYGENPPASEHIPPETPCVTEKMWRRACIAGCISEASHDAARMAFNRAAKALVAEGRARKWQEWVWLVRT
jgi:hypothetical protein